MPRAVPEWHGRNADVPPPLRVKLRIYARAEGRCAECKGKVTSAEYDHIKPLRDGGENREKNFQLLCRPCHGRKTSGEASDRAKVDRIVAKRIGITKPRNPMPGSKASKWKRTMDGRTVRR